MASDENNEVRLLIIGKTGNGKSTIGNIILGKRHFQTGCSMTSTTVKPALGTAEINGKQIKVVDTPDVSNLELDSDDVMQRVSTWKAMTSPDIHAVLLAVRCDVRYTREEHEIYLQLKRLWGGNSLARRLVVVFTFGDLQDSDLATELLTVCRELRSVLHDASERYVLFNDRATDNEKREQTNHLLDLVYKLDAEEKEKSKKRLLSGLQICPSGPLLSAGARPPTNNQRAGSDTKVLRLLLVGKAETGKSSTGNTILGRDVFPVHHSRQQAQHDKVTRMEEGMVDEWNVQVIDTPGIETGGVTQDPNYVRERGRASQLAFPGPHAILFLVRHHHVTREDIEGFSYLQKHLGQGLSHHTVVVLVGASLPKEPHRQLSLGLSMDSQNPDRSSDDEDPFGDTSSTKNGKVSLSPKGGKFQRSVSEADAGTWSKMRRIEHDEGLFFSDLLQEAGGKVWIVDNLITYNRGQQVRALLDIVDRILDNSGGQCFQGQSQKRPQGEVKNQHICWFL